MKEKLPPTASNKRKRELDRADPKHPDFEYPKTYKKKKKIVEKRTVVPPNTVEQLENFKTTIEGVRQHSGADTIDHIEDGNEAQITVGSEIQRESAQAALGAQPTLDECRSRIDSEGNIPSWGVLMLAHGILTCFPRTKWQRSCYEDHNLGTASQDDGIQFIFGHFLKLPGIPKELDFDNYEHYNCWKWGGSITDRNGGPTILKFREALDNYKVEDVVWDPYRDKRDYAHAFKEITYFYGALASPYHIEPYYLNRVVRQFFHEQGMPTKPRCPEIMMLGYLEFIDERKHVSMRRVTPLDQCEDVGEQYDVSLNEHATLSPNAHDTMPTRGESGGLDQQIIALNDKL
ncbi:hypothetical protein GIB67_023889 [Kingdonia uniflora]|uniref:Uncharacterized protein n=1 Tax=Kingdonia uniflora TaxID=39325 RepID=A0A7J7NG15_9MAGN|nr:hypothetical protein GIB67_023889 [Kingdonia uniflora]